MGEYIGKDYKGNKVFMAETAEIAKLQKGTERFLKTLAPFMGWDAEQLDHVFVSDESTIADFNLEDGELIELSKQLGFPITHESYIKDIAATI